ncbi:glycosyl transferase family 1, partial [Enterococcus faecalis]
EFKKYIEGLLEGKIPSTRQAGYQVAEQRSIKQIGYELKEVYETVLS